MMTDSEKHAMRDSVRTMTVSQAAALPLYDGVRGTAASGLPAEQYYALIDGASPDPVSEVQSRAEAVRDHAAEKLGDAWRPENDNRPARNVADSASAYAKMTKDISNAWRGER